MCVYLAAWPLQRLIHERPELRDKAVALSRLERVPLVTVCSRAAAQAGVRPGMPVAEARAIAPELEVREDEAEANIHALTRLAYWAERYSPLVGLEDAVDPESLLLDITGCAACFHGEDNLLRRALAEFTAAGWVPRIAIADSPGAAWAFAHYGKTPCLIPAGESEAALRVLPPAALRLSAKTLEDLRQLGIDTIGSLLALPRSDLPARFGPELLERLDQTLNRRPEVIVPVHAPTEIEAAQTFDFPTDRRQVLAEVLDGLTEELGKSLLRKNCAARTVDCRFYQVSEPALQFEVGLYKPSGCARYLASLLHARLEREQFKEAVRAVRLCVTRTAPLRGDQTEMYGSESRGIDGAAALVDCLSSRLGTAALARARIVDDFQPEYACAFEPLIGSEVRKPRKPAKTRRQRQVDRWGWSSPLRPLSLRPEPVAIEVASVVPDGPPYRLWWAGKEYRITRAWGPERIETGWWRGNDVQRDYYMIATDLGTRLWIFHRRLDGYWFLHGCFD
jgi:protein ImuB